MHEQADLGVREEIPGFDALSVRRHDDHGPVVRGVGVRVARQERVVHQRDVWCGCVVNGVR